MRVGLAERTLKCAAPEVVESHTEVCGTRVSRRATTVCAVSHSLGLEATDPHPARQGLRRTDGNDSVLHRENKRPSGTTPGTFRLTRRSTSLSLAGSRAERSRFPAFFLLIKRRILPHGIRDGIRLYGLAVSPSEHNQDISPTCLRAESTISRPASSSGVSGSRWPPTGRPTRFNAYFTGIGLGRQKSAWKSGSSDR